MILAGQIKERMAALVEAIRDELGSAAHTLGPDAWFYDEMLLLDFIKAIAVRRRAQGGAQSCLRLHAPAAREAVPSKHTQLG